MSRRVTFTRSCVAAQAGRRRTNNDAPGDTPEYRTNGGEEVICMKFRFPYNLWAWLRRRKPPTLVPPIAEMTEKQKILWEKIQRGEIG